MRDPRSVKLELSYVLNGKFMACRKLGEGGCGVIYEVCTLSDPSIRYACKAEPIGESKDEEILQMEEKVLRELNKAQAAHAVQSIEIGRADNFNYLLMSLLGPSISDLRKAVPEQKKKVGKGVKREMREPRRTVPFRGTARYCSINAHAREELGRHDDLWSLIYMLIEVIHGDLPWRQLDKEMVEKSKRDTEHDLLSKCPKEMDLIVQHLKALSYTVEPDYKIVRNLFCQMLRKNDSKTRKLDWEVGGAHAQSFANVLVVPWAGQKEDHPLTLDKLLDMPRSTTDITEKQIPTRYDHPHLDTNSSHDDTIEESKMGTVVEKTKSKEKSNCLAPTGAYAAKKQERERSRSRQRNVKKK